MIEALITYDAIAKIVAIHPVSHTKDGVTEFKERQADKLTEHIGPEHHPNMVAAMKQLQERLRNTSNQLFIHAFLSTLLVAKILKDGTLYWSQRSGKELGEFVWTIDAKDKSITKAEEMWRTLLLPFLETDSFTDPLLAVNDPAFDYSCFDKNFAIDQTEEKWRQHLDWVREVRGSTPQNSDPVDIKAILSDLTFANSANEIGLQIVDVVASAFHWACKGTLQKPGWEKLGSLFLNMK